MACGGDRFDEKLYHAKHAEEILSGSIDATYAPLELLAVVSEWLPSGDPLQVKFAISRTPILHHESDRIISCSVGNIGTSSGRKTAHYQAAGAPTGR